MQVHPMPTVLQKRDQVSYHHCNLSVWHCMLHAYPILWLKKPQEIILILTRRGLSVLLRHPWFHYQKCIIMIIALKNAHEACTELVLARGRIE